ncbi:Uncharacterised protein [Mycobacteroides abscessus subsp. abscessus]|uniref:hypothetical protein n=1 Tax=Mycobacteroides abscessus TaxID=36809 RepID=UPI00092CD665|nr:hypothetical protein [Mycobacteroides abscessus]SIH21678.1 Uncharacterised protein [Mycobacteroides abscessus subsp. abscessus]
MLDLIDPAVTWMSATADQVSAMGPVPPPTESVQYLAGLESDGTGNGFLYTWFTRAVMITFFILGFLGLWMIININFGAAKAGSDGSGGKQAGKAKDVVGAVWVVFVSAFAVGGLWFILEMASDSSPTFFS